MGTTSVDKQRNVKAVDVFFAQNAQTDFPVAMQVLIAGLQPSCVLIYEGIVEVGRQWITV